MHPITRGINNSIQQSASNNFSLFSHCYFAIHLLQGAKIIWIAILIAISIVIWNAIQKLYPFTRDIHCVHGTTFLDPDRHQDCDPDNFDPCKWGLISGLKLFRSRSISSVYMGKYRSRSLTRSRYRYFSSVLTG